MAYLSIKATAIFIPLLLQGVYVEPVKPRGEPPFPPLLTVPEPATPRNGRVEGMNAATFDKLQVVRQSGTSAINVAQANAIRDAVMADGKLDAAERDLLDELTSDRTRAITVIKAGSAQPPVTVMFGSSSGQSKQIHRDTIYPSVDFAKAWNDGEQGWKIFAVEFAKGGFNESRATAFVMGQLGKAWKESSVPNAYKPFRDTITRLHGYSAAQKGSGVKDGKQLMYKSAAMVDWQEYDRIPDFLYNWLKQPM